MGSVFFFIYKKIGTHTVSPFFQIIKNQQLHYTPYPRQKGSVLTPENHLFKKIEKAEAFTSAFLQRDLTIVYPKSKKVLWKFSNFSSK